MDEHDLAEFAASMKKAAAAGEFDGRQSAKAMTYIRHCRRIHQPTGTVVIFTRDTGHHSSGWFKNPDYERCLHLSLSPAPQLLIVPSLQRAELSRKTAALWVRAFFGDDMRHAWEESPKTPQGRERGVWHWRVFCDAAWQPMSPRGEVYSTELTEAGWKSASELGREIVSPLVPG